MMSFCIADSRAARAALPTSHARFPRAPLGDTDQKVIDHPEIGQQETDCLCDQANNSGSFLPLERKRIARPRELGPFKNFGSAGRMELYRGVA